MLAAILLISSYGIAQAGKSETPGALNNPAVPEAIRLALAPNGYRILPDITVPPSRSGIAKMYPRNRKMRRQTRFMTGWRNQPCSVSFTSQNLRRTIAIKPFPPASTLSATRSCPMMAIILASRPAVISCC